MMIYTTIDEDDIDPDLIIDSSEELEVDSPNIDTMIDVVDFIKPHEITLII